jgi:hypothetical protein
MHQRVQFGLFFFAALVGLGIFPGMLTARVSVTPERIEQTTGLWWYAEQKGFVYKDIAYVTIEHTRRNGSQQQIWHAHYKDGRLLNIDTSDLWDDHVAEIIALLTTYGVQVRA